MSVDRIFIEALQFDCIIGVWPQERTTPQPLVLEISLETSIGAAARSERLADTIDYAALSAHVRDFICERRFLLLETLAEETVERLLQADPRIDAVRFTVRKPGAIEGAAAAGVSIYRRRL